MKIAAGQKRMRLPNDTAVDAEVDLNSGTDGYFLVARLKVSVPGVDRDVARTLADSAHKLCPHSKATHGNIEVTTEVI